MAIREDFNLKYCTKPSVKREYFIMNKKCPVCQVALEIIGMIEYSFYTRGVSSPPWHLVDSLNSSPMTETGVKSEP